MQHITAYINLRFRIENHEICIVSDGNLSLAATEVCQLGRFLRHYPH